jgi:predicted ATPase/class 3 adenylate cyclase
VEIFTFLFTDIEGSTVLLRRLGESSYAEVLAGHHALIRSALSAHDGAEVDTQGDAFFAVFSSPRACVQAAARIQRAMAAHTWPGGEHVRVRIGIHTGEATRTPDGLVGLDVHRAARLAAVAAGGQVVLSETTAALVRDSLPPDLTLSDLGVHRLKDLGRPERIFQLNLAGTTAEFPPLRSLGNPALRNNLPAQLASFVGRERELAEVRALTGSSRLVTLTGPGGAGKTRLGLQAAAELLDGSADGVWLVELAALSDGEAVPQAIASALGIPGAPARSVLDGLLDALVFQHVLIVLDNCEHLIDACAKMADAILRRCPGVSLIATSREPLGIGGEVIYRVPSLSLPELPEPADACSPPGPGRVGFGRAGSLPGSGHAGSPSPASGDAVALFVARAAEQGVDLAIDEETGPLMVSICRRLDGLPLAIELAAARLRSLSLSGLRDRLDQRFRLLTGGSRAALERQQTLRATVDWSYSLLTEAERSLLCRLSVFADGFDLETGEAVGGAADIDVFDVSDLLGSLVDKSLVLAEPADPAAGAAGALRYRLLETIRQFAAERLIEAGEQSVMAAAAAHCEYFLRLAETAAAHLDGPDQGRWLARLDIDYANLRRAASYAAGDPDGTARVLRFGVALMAYWVTRTYTREGVELLRPALDRPEARADPALFGAALVSVCGMAPFVDMSLARPSGEQAVELGRELRDDRLLVDALAMLCAACFFAGEPDQGLAAGREAVERARQLGDDVRLGLSLMTCLLFSSLIEPADASQLETEAIACAERTGNHLLAWHLHNNASTWALHTGDIAAARAHLEQAARSAQAVGQDSDIVSLNFGWVRRAEGDPAGARSAFETGLRLARRTGDGMGLAYSTSGLACLAADLGDWHRAATLHGVAQAFLDRLGGPWQELEARIRQDSLAQIRAQLGERAADQAFAQGSALRTDEALRFALGPPAVPSTSGVGDPGPDLVGHGG